jgi:hypothetical protein
VVMKALSGDEEGVVCMLCTKVASFLLGYW